MIETHRCEVATKSSRAHTRSGTYSVVHSRYTYTFSTYLKCVNDNLTTWNDVGESRLAFLSCRHTDASIQMYDHLPGALRHCTQSQQQDIPPLFPITYHFTNRAHPQQSSCTTSHPKWPPPASAPQAHPPTPPANNTKSAKPRRPKT